MAISLFPAFAAFAVGFFVTSLELVTTKYPRTYFVVAKVWQFWVYSLIYGVLAATIDFFLPSLTASGTIKLSGVSANPWVQALAIGVSTKAFLHIRLFTVGVGANSFPVGIESLLQLFEPWLLRAIDVAEYENLLPYIYARAQHQIDLATAKGRALSHIPRSLPEAERTAFRNDIEASTTIEDVLELYLRLGGKSLFDSVFPYKE